MKNILANIKNVSSFLATVAKMNNSQIIEQYAELKKASAEFAGDYNDMVLFYPMIKAVSAIAVAKFGENWELHGMAIDHIDGNPRNNDPSNLRLVRPKQN